LIVVSDTSPILNLARIGRLELLPALYHQVIIPEAVYEELTVSKADLSPAIDLSSEPWLTIATPKDQARVQKLREDLDPGEAEAIVLAIERRADLLLVDERRARQIATAAGLTVTGLLGTVARAKLAGLIPLAQPVPDELIQTARFWIGPQLYQEVLKELGEI
jgi:predicted nucleic acid-binding protein